jgi:hypothetical protein
MTVSFDNGALGFFSLTLFGNIRFVALGLKASTPRGLVRSPYLLFLPIVDSPGSEYLDLAVEFSLRRYVEKRGGELL